MAKEQLGAVKLSPGEQYRIPWRIPCDSVLDDVRLHNIEGSVDVHYVQIGNVLVAAYSRRPKLMRVNDCVYIILENYGTIGGQCTVEIEYHPVA